MDYISVREVAAKWGISERRVQRLCEEGRIEGQRRMGHMWLIPREVPKPGDPRKSPKRENSIFETSSALKDTRAMVINEKKHG